MSPLVNELDSRVPVSAFNSFLSILQVLMNGRLKLVQQIYNENKSFIFSPGTYRSYVVWNKFCSNLFETVGARLFDSAEPAGHNAAKLAKLVWRKCCRRQVQADRRRSSRDSAY